MPKKYTATQWRRFLERLEADPTKFGMPERRKDSVVISSFNIRKLGKRKNKSDGAWQLLARYCQQCDLVAVQEVLDDLEGLNYLHGLLDSGWGKAVSDVTGGVPGGGGMVERLAFLFRWDRIKRTEVASDISYDRSAVVANLKQDLTAITKAIRDHMRKEAAYKAQITKWEKAGRKPPRPKSKVPTLYLPSFVDFIRTPHCVSFQIPPMGNAQPIEFLAVNAHLHFGTDKKSGNEREMEFHALLRWLISRAKAVKNLYHKNFILMGDLNLDFEDADPRREEIGATIKGYNKELIKSKKPARVNFPFLDVHPNSAGVFRTTARAGDTYDHIAFFAHDARLPDHKQNEKASKDPGGFDYGVFRFTDLIAEELHGKPLQDCSEAEQKSIYDRVKDDVSDHLPIWVRVPRPLG